MQTDADTQALIAKKKKRRRHHHHFLSASVWHSALNNTSRLWNRFAKEKLVLVSPKPLFFMTAVRCFPLMSFLKKHMTFVWGIFICWLSFSICLLKGHLLFDRMEKGITRSWLIVSKLLTVEVSQPTFYLESVAAERSLIFVQAGL